MMPYETDIKNIQYKVEKIRIQLAETESKDRKLYLNVLKAIRKNADIIKPNVNNFDKLVLIAHEILGLSTVEEYLLYSDVIIKKFLRRAYSIETNRVINDHKGAMEKFLINDTYIAEGLESGTKSFY